MQAAGAEDAELPCFTVLVVECQPRINWYEVFQGCALPNGARVQVEQATFQEITMTVYHDGPLVVELAAADRPHPGTQQNTNRTCKPDIVLMRSVQRSIYPLDSRNLLYALQHAGVPCVNSLHSLLCCLERPWVFGELKKIQRRLGDRFPLIGQTFYPSHRNMVIDPGFPCVVKVGACHAGYGKIKVDNRSAFEDVRSLVALNGDYATAEEFIKWDYDIRIQKIGNTYRAFRRQSTNWKGNVGNSSTNEDIPVTPEFKLWADECSKLFGGLDILAVDAVHSVEHDKVVILELNDTAIGLAHRHEAADHAIMRDIILLRLTHLYTIPNSVNDDVAAIAAAAMEEDGSLNLALATQHVRSLVAKSELEEEKAGESAQQEERKCIIS